MGNEILKLMDAVPNDGSVYLLEKLNEMSGFFCYQKHLIYVVENIAKLNHSSINTEYLSIKTHLFLSSIKNSVQFKDGYYNIIGYKGPNEDSKIDTFIYLCRIHAKNQMELDFGEFFYSLATLFKPLHDQQFRNLLGFWGELEFIRTVNTLIGRDISIDWHRNGMYSKYDFISSISNIEVKTTLSSELAVELKHHQIFNGDKNFLCVICAEASEMGETLMDIIADLRSTPNKFESLQFNLNLEKELQRVSPVEACEKKFILRSVLLYDVNSLNTLVEIPFEISQLRYEYDLGDAIPLDIESNQKEIWL